MRIAIDEFSSIANAMRTFPQKYKHLNIVLRTFQSRIRHWKRAFRKFGKFENWKSFQMNEPYIHFHFDLMFK